MQRDPWQVSRGPSARTLGSFMPQLAALAPAPSVEEQAKSAREAYDIALQMFEKERELSRQQRRPPNPAFAGTLKRAYDLCDRLTAKASWVKASGGTGGSIYAPRGRWKSNRSRTFSESFPRPPGAV